MPVIVLALKVLLAPLLVVGSSLAGRRWGPRLAGILVVLPIVVGPILLIVHLEHGSRFAARAAGAATLGVVSLAVFVVLLAFVSRRSGWLLTLATSWVAVLVVDIGLARLVLPAWVSLLLALAALIGTSRVLRRFETPAPVPRALPPWDLPARAVATGVLVVAVTTVADVLGPTATGVLAPFPIALSVVGAFALAQHGHAGAIALLRGVVPGLVGFALFCFLVAVTIDRWGAAAAFGLATAVAVAYAVVLTVRRPFAGSA